MWQFEFVDARLLPTRKAVKIEVLHLNFRTPFSWTTISRSSEVEKHHVNCQQPLRTRKMEAILLVSYFLAIGRFFRVEIDFKWLSTWLCAWFLWTPRSSCSGGQINQFLKSNVKLIFLNMQEYLRRELWRWSSRQRGVELTLSHVRTVEFLYKSSSRVRQ